MKKLIPILLVLCLFGSFAACGQQEQTAVAIITPEPLAEQEETTTEATQVTVPDMAPADSTAQSNNETDAAQDDQASRPEDGSATTNTGTNTSTNTGTDGDAESEDAATTDLYSVALGYVGSSRAALESAIGGASGSEYVDSCATADDGAKDGLLYYDGFYVWTILYSDGSEVVQGVGKY